GDDDVLVSGFQLVEQLTEPSSSLRERNGLSHGPELYTILLIQHENLIRFTSRSRPALARWQTRPQPVARASDSTLAALTEVQSNSQSDADPPAPSMASRTTPCARSSAVSSTMVRSR